MYHKLTCSNWQHSFPPTAHPFLAELDAWPAPRPSDPPEDRYIGPRSPSPVAHLIWRSRWLRQLAVLRRLDRAAKSVISC